MEPDTGYRKLADKAEEQIRQDEREKNATYLEAEAEYLEGEVARLKRSRGANSAGIKRREGAVLHLRYMAKLIRDGAGGDRGCCGR